MRASAASELIGLSDVDPERGIDAERADALTLRDEAEIGVENGERARLRDAVEQRGRDHVDAAEPERPNRTDRGARFEAQVLSAVLAAQQPDLVEQELTRARASP
jgi:hypothetical protein